MFVLAASLTWLLTFIVGFFILAPSTDDGYYIIASLGTAIKGSPGFWIGNEFMPSFFLPTAFTYVYGLLLKLTMVLGLDFGPFGFRVYQFLIILTLPLISFRALRSMFTNDHSVRFLLLLTLLSLTYFLQSAPIVRPEVLGAVLFTSFLGLRGKKIGRFDVSILILSLSGLMHPVYTLLAFAVFGISLIRRFRQTGLENPTYWINSLIPFVTPFAVLAVYYAFNLNEYQAQIGGRSTILTANLFASPGFILDNLRFWSDPDGIQFGLFGGYPAVAFVTTMLGSTYLAFRNRSRLWGDDRLWVVLPMVLVQWLVFFLMPSYVPYLAFTSFVSSLVIVMAWQRPFGSIVDNRKQASLLALVLVGFSLVFITFHVGKFVLNSDVRLTPSGIHAVVSPILDDDNAQFYTNQARLIPPLIDNFADGDQIKIHFLYLDPDCLPPRLLELANRNAETDIASLNPEKTYWGINLIDSKIDDQGTRSFVTKGAGSTVELDPTDVAYQDGKNLITRASSVRVTPASAGTCE